MTPVKPSEFVVNVTLSDKAKDEMARRHETVIISASCSKTLPFNVPHRKEEMMPDSLGSVDVEVAPGEAAQFEEDRFHQGETKGISEESLQILINVFSGRRSSRDNLLACTDAQEGTLESFKGTAIPVHCVLIHGEEDRRILEQLRGTR